MEGRKMIHRIALLACVAQALSPAQVITFNDDGGWCWFQDERVLLHGGKLVIGSVAAGAADPARRGDIELTVYDPATGEKKVIELHDRLLTAKGVYDDHNAPALAARPDGRLLAVYSMHGPENRFYYRIAARPGDAAGWQPEKTFVPSETSRITYSNLHVLSGENGRIYNFYRGLNDSFKPSYAWSGDGGETWTSGSVFIDVPLKVRHRPYVKYASNGIDTIHFAYTDGHPRNFDNSVYHAFYRDGKLHRSDGTAIRSLAEGLKAPGEGTRVFAGDAKNVAWVSDVHLDREGRPVIAYSVQKDDNVEDHRYRYARWDGSKWIDREIAYAGTRLYPGEDDYTGLIALDPDDVDTAYISANADPVSGERLAHWEIFRGTVKDGGSWSWAPVTRESTADNLRPVVPTSDGRYSAVLWLRGKYTAYTDYDLDVVGLVKRRN
jgi:hypothetical protein